MTDINAAQANGEGLPIDYVAAETRLQFYADTLRVKAPAKLLGDDGAPDQTLLDFCVQYGASLDWIFLGDVRGMIHDCYKVAQGERA